MVQDAVGPADLGVFTTQGVKAVRAGHDDLAVDAFDTFEQVVDRLDVLRCQLLEQEFVAGASGRVAGTGLRIAEHQEFHPGHRQQFGNRLGGLFGTVVERACAAHPEQVLETGEGVDVLAVDRHVEVDLVDPGQPFLGVLAPGVALVLEVLEEPGQLTGELRFHHHLIAAHVHDVVDVFDVDRALFDAGAAGGAGPQHVGVDHTEGGGITHQWAGGLQGGVGGDPAEAGLRYVVLLGVGLATHDFTNAANRGVLGRGFFVVEDVGRLGEEVVA